MDPKGKFNVLTTAGKPSVVIDGDHSSIWAGFADGTIVLRPQTCSLTLTYQKKRTVLVDGGAGNISLGSPGIAGNLAVFSDKIGAGENDDFAKAAIHLDGQTGDIVLGNADCAEDFDIVDGADVPPGTVMVLHDSGCAQIRESTDAYDSRVVGVISGAGTYRPGIILDRQPQSHGRAPLAVVGKVFCKVDATFGSIRVGDLLTSSPRPGHAMRATNARQAFGAVLGKALGPHSDGTGLIPVLVALQ